MDLDKIPTNNEKTRLPAWFSTDICYLGSTFVTFSNPQGSLRGAAQVTQNEKGNLSIEVEVEKIHIPSVENSPELESASAMFRMGYLITGNVPTTSEGTTFYGIGGSEDICYADIKVETSEGVFSASSAMYAGETNSWVLGNADNHKLVVRFEASEARFDAHKEAQADGPKYWVLPLENFIASCRTSCENLHSHRLRILPTPLIPEGLSTRDEFLAQVMGYGDYRLICFEFNGAPGFIEPLADYQERKRQLETGHARNLITAVLVGEVGTHSTDDLDQWFPLDFVRLLGLASGQEVGAGWIEFRGEAGNLVSRVHKHLGHPAFVKGTTLIHEDVVRDPNNEGIGYLLTKAAHCSEFGPGTSPLSVAIRQLLRSGLSNWMVEERITLLVRVVEGLSKHLRIGTKELLLELDAAQQAQVLSIRDAAVAEIREMARVARTAGNHNQQQALLAIANRVKSATTYDDKFGRSVVGLLTHFGLPDAEIMEEHYRQHPRPDGISSWERVLSHYRNTPIHQGYFDTLRRNDDMADAIKVMLHLHDVLARVIFKMLGYDGGYQPVMKSGPVNYAVDWVTPSTSAADLGY